MITLRAHAAPSARQSPSASPQRTRAKSLPTPEPPPPPPPPPPQDAKTALLAELYSAELQMEQITYQLGGGERAAPRR